MRNRLLLLGLPLALVCLASAAQAAVRTDYDPIQKKWVTYDPKSDGFFHGGTSSVPREFINYDGPYGPNTIVINTDERRLYYIYQKGKAIKYGIGVGREGFQWSGTDTISRKSKWPDWTPPPEMIAREKVKGRILPNHMAGGLNNPLGARALYIGARIYRIHGSNEPWTIGHAVSSGCIRLTNEDVADLYDRVSVGTRVIVLLSTQPQTEVASTRSVDKPMQPKASAPLPVRAVASPVVALKAPAKPLPPIEVTPPVVEPKPVMERGPEQKPDRPAIEVRASLSAAVSPAAAFETKAMIEVKKPRSVPEAATRKDEPVDTSPVAGQPQAPAADISGEGRS